MSQPPGASRNGHGTHAHPRERHGLAAGLLMFAHPVLGLETPCTAQVTASTFSLQTTCSQPTPQMPTACTPSPPLWMASRWRTSPWPSQTKPCPTEIAARPGVREGPPAGHRCHHLCSRGLLSPAILLPGSQPWGRQMPAYPLIYRRFTTQRGNGCSHLADATEHRHPISRKIRQGTRAPLVYAPARGKLRTFALILAQPPTPLPQKDFRDEDSVLPWTSCAHLLSPSLPDASGWAGPALE